MTASMAYAGEPSTLYLDMEPTDNFEFPWRMGMFNTGLLFTPLIFADPELVSELPGLAEDWTVSDDGLVYTFYLRDNISWHDGEPITVEDVVWSLETAGFSPRTSASIVNALATIDEVQIIDERTVEVTLDHLSAEFVFGLTQLDIMPKHLLAHEKPEELHLSDFWLEPVGSGPFRILERAVGDYTIMEAFDEYYRGRPKIDRVVLQEWYNPIVAAESEQLDFGFSQEVQIYQEISALPHMTAFEVPIGYLRGIWCNFEVLDSKEVRQALMHAVDTEAIVASLLDGVGEVLPVFMIPGFWTNEDLEAYPYDPDRARQLLEETNWDSNKVIELSYYYSDAFSEELLTVIQHYWGQVGIRAELRFLHEPTPVWFEERDFDVIYAGFSLATPTLAIERYHSEDPNNTHVFQNEEVDRLIEQARTTMDEVKRKAIYDQIQEILHEEMAILPIYTLPQIVFRSERLQGPSDANVGNLWHRHLMEVEKWEIVK